MLNFKLGDVGVLGGAGWSRSDIDKYILYTTMLVIIQGPPLPPHRCYRPAGGRIMALAMDEDPEAPPTPAVGATAP